VFFYYDKKRSESLDFDSGLSAEAGKQA